MTTVEDRLAALESRVAALTARVEGDPVDGHPPHDAPAGWRRDLWALEGLKRRLPEDAGAGAVLYTGAVRLGDSGQYEWQYGMRTDELLAADWAELAGPIAALAHPVRLRLVHAILSGRRTAAELADVEGLGTSGQLYHHLRQLVSAGWLRSAGRGRNAVPAERVVPLLVVLAAAGA